MVFILHLHGSRKITILLLYFRRTKYKEPSLICVLTVQAMMTYIFYINVSEKNYHNKISLRLKSVHRCHFLLCPPITVMLPSRHLDPLIEIRVLQNRTRYFQLVSLLVLIDLATCQQLHGLFNAVI